MIKRRLRSRQKKRAAEKRADEAKPEIDEISARLGRMFDEQLAAETQDSEERRLAEEKQQAASRAMASARARPGTQDLETPPPTPLLRQPPTPMEPQEVKEVSLGEDAAKKEMERKMVARKKRHAQWQRFMRSLEGHFLGFVYKISTHDRTY